MTITYVDKTESEQTANSLGLSGSVTLVGKKKLAKAEANVLSSNSIQSDDEFDSLYSTGPTGDGSSPKGDQKSALIRPPFDMKNLLRLTYNNNALGQCIAAMEVNIDGTGYVLEIDGEVADESEQEEMDNLADFFNEPYPGMSMTTMRRQLRRDQEATGNAYIEVLRSISGELVFLKQLPPETIRLLRLDKAVPVTTTVKRMGKEEEITMMMRERRYAQMVGNKLIYFKQYNASRDLNKKTGNWAEDGETLDADTRATEIIHLTVHNDAGGAYGIPRWITQIPSVLGSRKAEELNLDFFNAGGLPPALILVQGGQMTDEVRKNLQTYLSGKGASIHRAAIVDVYAAGGTLDSAGSVSVKVERFGSERQQDSMFENYDAKCEKRTRSSFRLPPLFVGKADDYSFATAFASYAVAEAQVFQPERDEFDEIINVTVMKELSDKYTYRSLPLNVRDATQQLKGLDMVKDKIEPDDMVEAVNEIVNLNLAPKEEQEEDDDMEELDESGNPIVPNPPVVDPNNPADPEGTPVPKPGDPAAPVAKMDPIELIHLAKQWAAFYSMSVTMPEAEVHDMVAAIKALTGAQRDLFDSYVSDSVFSDISIDAEGGKELFGCAHDILTHEED